MSTQTTEQTGMRWCSGCKQMKPLSAWFRSMRSRSGSKCAECLKAYQREHYRASHNPLRDRVDELERIVAELQAKVA